MTSRLSPIESWGFCKWLHRLCCAAAWAGGFEQVFAIAAPPKEHDHLRRTDFCTARFTREFEVICAVVSRLDGYSILTKLLSTCAI